MKKIDQQKKFVLRNFKDPDDKLEIINTNILLDKTVLLKSTKVPHRTIYIFQANNERFCHL